MNDVSYLLEGIPSVCGPKLSRINQARTLVAENSNNIGFLVESLNKLCGGNFVSKATIANVIITQEVASSIAAGVSEVGGTPSETIALRKKVGSAELNTPVKDLSGAVNYLDTKVNTAQSTANTALSTANTAQSDVNAVEAILGNGAELGAWGFPTFTEAVFQSLRMATYTPVGTLGSFYEYIPGVPASNAYRLIATGSTSLKDHMQAWQKCANWAESKFQFSGTEYKQPITNIEFSLSNGGPHYPVKQQFSGVSGGQFSNVAPLGSLESLCKWALDHVDIVPAPAPAF